MRSTDPDSERIPIGKGDVPSKERWPFSKLEKGNFFPVQDLTQWVAVRTAASRAGTRLKRKFSVRKVTVKGKEVIRVYLVT